ncbi:MAG: glycosyltransferase [Roseomonas sp.]|nr:glycosyltransferase [Rhodocyclaceae bacterium]MCA3274622.1 glycosyltransferase [Roseomonas sp.]MCA3281378.1 glycosyltransferase [Roseomonas sp.]MCA3296949.1 glycosyltransferase [Roseomonas sp.]
MRNIAFIVQGLFELSDSIGYDCIFQYNVAKKFVPPDVKVRIFAERFNPELYPGVFIESVDLLLAEIRSGGCPDKIIYHFCDGWPEIDQVLRGLECEVIVRWHNNTPPWFYMAGDMKYARRSHEGFKRIAEFARLDEFSFWVNSNFTKAQLLDLGKGRFEPKVVYPASPLLTKTTTANDFSLARKYTESDKPSLKLIENAKDGSFSLSQADFQTPNEITLLWVSRIVAHKGHRFVIEAAVFLRTWLAKMARTPAEKLRVRVVFAGRGDKQALETMPSFQSAIADATAAEVSIVWASEVSNQELESLFESATMFVCLSEHEGFGLPIFEAMRKKVPVVCFATTAFSDWTKRHPFFFPELDYSSVAAATILCLNKHVREDLIHYQKTLAEEIFSEQVIERQIVHALFASDGDFSTPTLSKIAPSSLAGDPPVVSDIVPRFRDAALRLAEEIRENTPLSPIPSFPHDHNHNRLSQYDLIALENAFTKIDALQSEIFNLQLRRQSAEEGGGIALRPQLFSFNGLTGDPNDFYLEPPEVPTLSHAVFGPYVRLPSGSYCATFLVRCVKGSACMLVFDVHVAGQGVKQEYQKTISGSGSIEKVALTFHLHSTENDVEFRIRRGTDNCARFWFDGVQLEALPNLNDVLLVPSRPSVVVSAEQALKPAAHGRWSLGHAQRRLDRRSAGAFLRSSSGYIASKAHFLLLVIGLFRNPLRHKAFLDRLKKADAARNAQKWTEAYEWYTKALELVPTDHKVLMQAGHAAKESGHSEESIRIYREALKAGSDPAEVYLSLGHVYKVRGNIDEAVGNYLFSIRKNPASLNALRELAWLLLHQSELRDAVCNEIDKLRARAETLEFDES